MNPLEHIYFAAHRVKTSLDLKAQRRLPVPVISVGNITTGGTGKTPAVIAIASQARERGLSPCILTRGYRGKLRGPMFVSAENYSADVGDEPLLTATLLHDVPVVKCPRRYEGGVFALENLTDRPGLFILDDGFQHRRLYRDLDVVLVSGISGFAEGKLLPLGRLREPLGGLARAHAIVITKSPSMDLDAHGELVKKIRFHNARVPLYVSSHVARRVTTEVSRHAGQGLGVLEPQPNGFLTGKDVFAMCGIAEPESFMRSLEAAGARVVGSRFFPDHYGYTPADIQDVAIKANSAGANWIMTTEKDIMRLRSIDRLPENLAALGVEFDVQQAFFDQIFSDIS